MARRRKRRGLGSLGYPSDMHEDYYHQQIQVAELRANQARDCGMVISANRAWARAQENAHSAGLRFDEDAQPRLRAAREQLRRAEKALCGCAGGYR